MELRLHPLSEAGVPNLVFEESRVLVGRGADCELRLFNLLVSRHHAELVISEEDIVVRDLSSTNGTFVNGQRIGGEQVLEDGDILIFAAVVFEVQLDHSAIHALRRCWQRDARVQESLTSLVRQFKSE